MPKDGSLAWWRYRTTQFVRYVARRRGFEDLYTLVLSDRLKEMCRVWA